ncbi:MAG: TetR/AcrR family transcriptional regulator, partial [Oscillospiraceae bacterium]|nr:TetR/AcrR family transcriptional regulator [Oscillospiraceae bacterium]
MARKRVTSTKYEIIQVATEFFLEKGVSETSPKMIADELGLSTGNITYYFPNKDQLLSELVKMLCTFQQNLIEQEAGEGLASVTAVCLELAVMAALCEDNPIAKDFYIASYLGERCLEVIQRNDAKRAIRIFGVYHPDWTEAYFEAA